MSRRSTLNVSLTPELKQFVQARVESGSYESASEVIRDSLRALEQRERSAFWADVNSKIAEARREVKAGDVVDGAKAMDALLAEIDRPGPSRSARRRKPR